LPKYSKETRIISGVVAGEDYLVQQILQELFYIRFCTALLIEGELRGAPAPHKISSPSPRRRGGIQGGEVTG
jgi:hypothetical protein